MLGSLISAPGANVLLSKKRIWENFSPTPLTAQVKSLLAPEGTKENPLSIYDLASGRHGFHTLDTYEGRNGEPLTLHKYLYTHGNPVSNIDPSGNITLNQISVTLAILATISNIAVVSTAAIFGTTDIGGEEGDRWVECMNRRMAPLIAIAIELIRFSTGSVPKTFFTTPRAGASPFTTTARQLSSSRFLRPYSTIFSNWLKGRRTIRIPNGASPNGLKVVGRAPLGTITLHTANLIYVAGSAYVLTQAILCARE